MVMAFLTTLVGSLSAANRTFTIDETTLRGIRDAVEEGSNDQLIRDYWQYYTVSFREPDPNNERDYHDYFNLLVYTRKA